MEGVMKTIQVPLDGSKLAEQALPSVRTLAPLLGARVQLMHVVSEADRYHLLADAMGIDEAGGLPLGSGEFVRSWEPLRQNAEDYLNEHAAALAAEGIDAGVEVQLGWPAEAIVAAAEREHVAMIAMATHGYSGLKRWALGSVTDKVVHATKTPLLAVRGVDAAAAQRPLRRILAPLDGSELARQALPLAVELAICARAELILLTVATPQLLIAPELMIPPPAFNDRLDQLQERLTDELGLFAEKLAAEHVPVTSVAVSGFPAEVIIDQAQQRQADLIVMATHGASGLRRWALGSVADKVLHAAPAPLLLVRAQM
jgi:nucleotide-binding universal stress UspA family protein